MKEKLLFLYEKDSNRYNKFMWIKIFYEENEDTKKIRIVTMHTIFVKVN